jgi:MFS family permease
MARLLGAQPQGQTPMPRPRRARRNKLLVRKYLLRNYTAHSVEGGLYMGGMRFLSAEAVLPVVLHSLGGPAWLVAMAPVLTLVGMNLTPLIVAHRIERMDRHKPYVTVLGFFQRLPYLLAGAALIWLPDRLPWLALAAVALAPLLTGLSGGLVMTAWKELVAKTIPPERRSGVWAIRYIISSGIGLVAGGVVAAVLHVLPGPAGYGVLHLLTFLCLAASFIVIVVGVRETPYVHEPKPHRRGLGESLRQVPVLLRGDRRLRHYLIGSALGNSLIIVMPFLSLHALSVLGKPESFAGFLVISQMVGGILGNIVAGYLGDRFGGKVPLMTGIAMFIGLTWWAVIAGAEWEFLGVFFLLGWAWFSLRVGRMTLDLEIAPEQGRPTYQAVIAVIAASSMLLTSQLGSAAWAWSGRQFVVPAIIASVTLMAALVSFARFADPRKTPAGG